MFTVVLIVGIAVASMLLAFAVDERLSMQENLYDEDEKMRFVRLSADCHVCKVSHSTDVTEDRWLQYCRGALVQDVWPHRSVTTRELAIANRPGNLFGAVGFICEVCMERMVRTDEDKARVEGFKELLMGWPQWDGDDD
jgi:hypothetical protein